MLAMLELVGRVLLVAGMSALLPNLKGGSLMRPFYEPQACHDAVAVGASCQVCNSKFKLCKGHYVYEPFTAVLFEALVTIVLGVVITYVVVPNRRVASKMLLDWASVKRVLPIGATYALGDLMDLAAARNVSGTTLLVSSQMRLPLCALLRSWLLGRRQTAMQWALLLLISLLCVGHVLSEIGGAGDDGLGLVATAASAAGATVGVAAGDGAGGLAAAGVAAVAWISAAASDGAIGAFPLILGKCLISCGGAVHAEYFLQHKDVTVVPLWVTQVHFKTATMLGAIAVGCMQGRRGGRILAQEWRGDLFTQFPPGVSAGDARMPFFGGWDANTWLLVGCLVLNNFLIADQMRRLTSVAKYVAYAFGLVMSYCSQLWSGREFNPVQAGSCFGIALLAVAYISLPGPVAVSAKKNE